MIERHRQSDIHITTCNSYLCIVFVCERHMWPGSHHSVLSSAYVLLRLDTECTLVSYCDEYP